MARTKAQTRAYINEIVDIVEDIRVMNLRKREVAKKLGYGTWRTAELPGIAVVCSRGSGGWVVQWKAVAQKFADRLGLKDTEVTRATYGHRKMTHRSPNVAVRKDKANRNNPKLKTA